MGSLLLLQDYVSILSPPSFPLPGVSARAQSSNFRWEGGTCALTAFFFFFLGCPSRRAPPPPITVALCPSAVAVAAEEAFPEALAAQALGLTTEAPGNTSGSSAAFSSSPSPSPPQALTLLVMQPCGGDGEAVGAALLPPQQGLQQQPTPGLASEAAAPSSSSSSSHSSFMVFCDLVPAADGGDGGAESAGSPGGGGLDDLDEDDESGGAQSGGGGGGKNCTYQGCRETTTQVAKQRKPWMCKRHRNKMYKDKYKRKKSDQAQGSGGGGGGGSGNGGNGSGGVPVSVAPAAAQPAGNVPGSVVRVEDCTESSISLSKQRTGNIGDRPAKPTLLEQVLNQKRLSLLRSPEVVHFLQKRQQLLSQQTMDQRQHFSGAPV